MRRADWRSRVEAFVEGRIETTNLENLCTFLVSIRRNEHRTLRSRPTD